MRLIISWQGAFNNFAERVLQRACLPRKVLRNRVLETLFTARMFNLTPTRDTKHFYRHQTLLL